MPLPPLDCPDPRRDPCALVGAVLAGLTLALVCSAPWLRTGCAQAAAQTPLHVVATCTVEPAERFVPMEGWTITAVHAAGRQETCHGHRCWAIEPRIVLKTTVTLQRPIQPNDPVEPPKGCDMAVTAITKEAQ